MKFLTLLLILAPTAAMADPVTAFFVGILGANLGAVVSSIVINLAFSAVLSVFTPKQKGQQQPDAKVNYRGDTAARWQAMGTVAIGGSLGTFAERDSTGAFWYIVAHADAEITGTPSYILDGIPVTMDGSGNVTTNEFTLDSKGAIYPGTGAQAVVFRLYTVTPSAGAAFGALPSDFTTAFPSLPANFKLAGVAYTIVRVAPLDRNRYNNIMHFRGALGLGEPAVVVVGNFNRMYDPRNGAHNIAVPSTWTASNGNPAIIWAWWRTSRYGRNRPMTEINWTNVAAQANICDTTVLNRSSVSTPLYRCGVAFPDTQSRQDCEAQILATADAFVAYDDNGLAYPVVGYYVAPTLTFSAARDILSAQTQITDDGELAVDGVVVTYTDPTLGYTSQPCAPWQNLNWYDGVSAPNYLQVQILGCQNHNQAVRLAKAIGQRAAPLNRAALGVTVKGCLANGQRIITLDYDATFQGDYEIVSPIEENPSGMVFGFSVVPVTSTRWTLGAGEEGVPPSATPAMVIVPPSYGPGALSAVTATGFTGAYKVLFTTPNDPAQYAVYLFRGATNVFASAGQISPPAYVGPNAQSYALESGVTPGNYYIWAVPYSKTGQAGPTSGPYTVTVT